MEGRTSTAARVDAGEVYGDYAAPAREPAPVPRGRMNTTYLVKSRLLPREHRPCVTGQPTGRPKSWAPHLQQMTREVIVAGDSNISRFARTLTTELGEDQWCVEVLLNRGDTTEVIHDHLSTYISEARKVPRLFILHVGVNDVSKTGT